jgi:hypothetical protein
MSEPLYCVRKRGEVMTSPVFFTALFPQEPCATPPEPLTPEGEWYCHNEDCDVHEVTVSLKYLDGPPPKGLPRLKCPACGQLLSFHHWLKTLTLVRVNSEP